MSFKSGHFRPSCHIPEPRCPVIRPGSEARPVRGESNTRDRILVAFEPSDFHADLKVPQQRCPVVGPGGETCSVRGEGDAGDRTLRALVPDGLGTVREVPKSRRSVPTASGKARPIRGKGDTFHQPAEVQAQKHLGIWYHGWSYRNERRGSDARTPACKYRHRRPIRIDGTEELRNNLTRAVDGKVVAGEGEHPSHPPRDFSAAELVVGLHQPRRSFTGSNPSRETCLDPSRVAKEPLQPSDLPPPARCIGRCASA